MAGAEAKRSADFEAQQLDKQSKAFQTQAAQDEANRRNDLESSLETIQSMRSGRGVGLDSPTGQAILTSTTDRAERHHGRHRAPDPQERQCPDRSRSRSSRAACGLDRGGLAEHRGERREDPVAKARSYLNKEVHAAQVAQIADFRGHRLARQAVEARDEFSGDPKASRNGRESSTDGAIAEVPGWMAAARQAVPVARVRGQAYGAILGEKRAQDKHLAGRRWSRAPRWPTTT
jgi:hypothetical protein